MIDQIIDFNKNFVAQKSYEKYLTDKYPDKGGPRDVDNIVGGYQLAYWKAGAHRFLVWTPDLPNFYLQPSV